MIKVQIDKIYSEVLDKGKVTTEGINELILRSIEPHKTYWVVAHKTYAVQIGKLNKGKFNFYPDIDLEPEQLLEIRFFDNDWELHMIKVNGEYMWRTRRDGQGSKIETYDEIHAVYGTLVEHINEHWSLLREDRGSRIYFPSHFSPEANRSENTKVYYKVRNYIADRERLEFEDARLVGFFDDKGFPFQIEKEGI